jgi:hypothetical protein
MMKAELKSALFPPLSKGSVSKGLIKPLFEKEGRGEILLSELLGHHAKNNDDPVPGPVRGHALPGKHKRCGKKV